MRRLKVMILMALSIIAITTGCSAKEPTEKGTLQTIVASDTIMQKALTDSIYRVLTHAKKIEISVLPIATDSASTKIAKKISSKDFGLLNFIVTNPKNYLSNNILYGVFAPQLQVEYSLKKESIILRYDFGLRKWGVFDAEEKEINMFDLASDNMLRFACKQFPDNTFFYELLMTREPEESNNK